MFCVHMYVSAAHNWNEKFKHDVRFPAAQSFAHTLKSQGVRILPPHRIEITSRARRRRLFVRTLATALSVQHTIQYHRISQSCRHHHENCDNKTTSSRIGYVLLQQSAHDQITLAKTQRFVVLSKTFSCEFRVMETPYRIVRAHVPSETAK